MVEGNFQLSAANLKAIKLLQSFTEEELSGMIRLGKSISYESHANIIIEGELTWGLYIILDGTVAVSKMNKLTGNVYDVGEMKSGSFFGEMSLIDDNPRSATVRATSPCQLFFLPKDAFLQFLENSTELKIRFFSNCIKLLVERLRDLGDHYVVSQYQLWKTALKKENTSI